jgi:hypothetical protein
MKLFLALHAALLVTFTTDAYISHHHHHHHQRHPYCHSKISAKSQVETSLSSTSTNDEDNDTDDRETERRTTSSSSSSSSFSPSDDSTTRNQSLEGSRDFDSQSQGAANVRAGMMIDPINLIANWVSSQYVVKQTSATAAPIPATTEQYSSWIRSSIVPPSTYAPISNQIRTIIRVGLPSILTAIFATSIYPSITHWLQSLPADIPQTLYIIEPLYTDAVLTVLSNDLSQYIQNILTTCALLFGLLVGQAYYFTYKEQERVYYALYVEVTEAKSLLEQIALLSYGRRNRSGSRIDDDGHRGNNSNNLYSTLLTKLNEYVKYDLEVLSLRDPVDATISFTKQYTATTTDTDDDNNMARRKSNNNEDPLESILYATSVGLPGPIYDTVLSLRRARSERCGAIQTKLPNVQMIVLRLLGLIVLITFPICGSGSSSIAPNVLVLQSVLFGILAFGLTTVLGVVDELRNSTNGGAYGVDGVLSVMVRGLKEELDDRLRGEQDGSSLLTFASPSPLSRNGAVVDDDMLFENDSAVGFDSTIMNANYIPEGKTHSSSRRHAVKSWLRQKFSRQ